MVGFFATSGNDGRQIGERERWRKREREREMEKEREMHLFVRETRARPQRVMAILKSSFVARRLSR